MKLLLSLGAAAIVVGLLTSAVQAANVGVSQINQPVHFVKEQWHQVHNMYVQHRVDNPNSNHGNGREKMRIMGYSKSLDRD
jgi:hypothetical protein